MDFTEKLKKVVQYVAFRCDPYYLGDVRLNKILWKADVLMHMERGESITGWRYLKFPLGPMLDDYYTLLRKMESEGMLSLAYVYEDNCKKRIIETNEFYNNDLLSPEEMKVLDEFIIYVTSKSTREISDETHDMFYEMTGDREEIPFGPVSVEPSEEAIQWAQGVMKEYDQVHT